MDGMELLGDWHRLCTCSKAAAIIILLALLPCSQMAVQNLPANTPTPTPEGDTLVENVNIELLPASEQQPSQSEEQNYNHGDGNDDYEEDLDGDAEVKVTLPEDGEHWKTKIIIGCTVTAAVEILVVIFIVAYWREIRWTLRKFSCPCEDYNNHTNHEAMERHPPATSSTEADVVHVYGVQRQGHRETNTYSTARQQDEEEEEDDEERITEEVCLETSSV